MTTQPLDLPAGTRVSDAIIGVLEEAGVRFVVGIPGGHTGPLFSSLFEHPTIRTVLVREESIGTTMAEAFGRLTGQPIAVIGQGEWMVGNAGQGLLEAHLGASPVIVLTDMTDAGPLAHHGPYQDGSANYGSWDARSAFSAVCKRVMVSDYPEQAVQHVQLALKHAVTGEPGPVAVIFRRDALAERLDPQRSPRLYPTSRYLPQRAQAVDQAALDAAAQVLRAAQRPVVIAGNGVRLAGAGEAVRALAAQLDAPIVTTSSGKGVVDETAPTSGGVIGAFGWASANALVGDSDVVVVVGSKLGPADTGDEHPGLLDPSRQTLIHIDVEPLNVAWTFPIDHPLVGDAASLVPALTAAIGEMIPHPRTAERRVADAQANDPRRTPEQPAASTSPFLPHDVIARLRAAIADDAIVTADAGENRLFMMHWFATGPGGDYLQPAAGGGMGYALPAALAAKLAYPERTVVAVCGDGGFGMSMHSLMTAVQEDLPIVVVVLNNQALGWVAHGLGRRAIASHFADFDHASIARAIGCDAFTVVDEHSLDQAFAAIDAAVRPTVIDVPLSMAVSFKDLLSDFSSHERQRSGY
ncbi:MAG TPA: thiamine pyrophosphate-binding protein [Ilumatobacter sp.]|nr:thiamine pyrophosphate-binding protein [Ilumatobacter sp.]